MMLRLGACEDGVERVGELAVPVSDEKSELGGTVAEVHQ
jgi:hypothetical protein